MAYALDCLPEDILRQPYRSVNALAQLKAGVSKGHAEKRKVK